MPALTRDAALTADDLPREKVDVPEWRKPSDKEDPYVFVRGMTGVEKDAWECYCIEQRAVFHSSSGFPGIRASVVVRCTVDDKGERLFLDTDVEAVGAKNGKALDRIWTVAARLSGITEEDVEKLKNA